MDQYLHRHRHHSSPAPCKGLAGSRRRPNVNASERTTKVGSPCIGLDLKYLSPCKGLDSTHLPEPAVMSCAGFWAFPGLVSDGECGTRGSRRHFRAGTGCSARIRDTFKQGLGVNIRILLYCPEGTRSIGCRSTASAPSFHHTHMHC